MKTKKIAILGASEPHLPLFLKAKELGLITYCFAWDKGAYCKEYADYFFDISIIEKEKIAAICESEGIDGIISNALEPAVLTMAFVSQKLHFNGISYATALRARNKFLMRQRIKEYAACMQPEFYLYDLSSLPTINYPVIVKPTDGSCSNGVTKVNNETELHLAIERAMNVSEKQECLIEEYIEGREISVESISYHGRNYVLAITDKETTGAPYFVEIAHHQPSNLSEDIQNRVKTVTDKILKALEITNGASHAEFKIDSLGNIYFIEIGARGGGDFISYNLVELSTGYDYIKAMINVALNQFEVPNLIYQKYSGVYFLSKETAYLKGFIEKNKDQDWVQDYHIDNGELKEIKKSQDRSGYIIYQSDKRILI